jgi:hypothetical protein
MADPSAKRFSPKDGEKSRELSGDVVSRIRRRDKEVRRQSGDAKSRMKGIGYISKRAKERYKGMLDEASR